MSARGVNHSKKYTTLSEKNQKNQKNHEKITYGFFRRCTRNMIGLKLSYGARKRVLKRILMIKQSDKTKEYRREKVN